MTAGAAAAGAEAALPTVLAALLPAPERLRAVPGAPGHDPVLLEAAASACAALVAAAAADGVTLLAVSGHRDVARQTAIWNRKMHARRGQGMSASEALDDVLVYSAPPGWSRHHWGTDVDVVGGALADHARLEPDDWERGGACAEAAVWLAAHAADFGFLRPYDRRRRGHDAEPWHWSFAPIARQALRALAALDWRPWLATEPYAGARLVAERAPELFQRYVLEVADELR